MWITIFALTFAKQPQVAAGGMAGNRSRDRGPEWVDGVDKVADERVEALYWHATSISLFSTLRLERDFILDLHDLIAGCEGPPKALDLAIAGGIECSLQFDVQGACTNPASVHRTQHLDVSNGVEAEALGIRVLTNSMMRGTAVSGSSALTK